jgi:lycopene cyclase domain-containing protein
MPEYSLASAGLLAVLLVVAWLRGLLQRRSTWLALALFAAATVAADLVLTGLPIVTYGASARSGLGIGPMPIEDLLYGLALFLTAALAWDAAGPRRSAGSARTGHVR